MCRPINPSAPVTRTCKLFSRLFLDGKSPAGAHRNAWGLVGYELPAVVRSYLIRSKISSRWTSTSLGASTPIRTWVPFTPRTLHNNVRTHRNGLANSPREYQHISLPACL